MSNYNCHDIYIYMGLCLYEIYVSAHKSHFIYSFFFFFFLPEVCKKKEKGKRLTRS